MRTWLIVFLMFPAVCWGASIAVNINPGQSDDGDVLVAVNNRRIQSVHAQHICHKDKIGFKPDGYREAGTLLDMMLSKTRQYKFERISRTEIRRTNLKTLDQDVIGPNANADGEYMDVPLYIERRLRHPKHLIFGTPGNEYWYGGNTDQSQTAVDAVWTEIEARTPNRKADFTQWPFTDTELRHYAIRSVADMTDEQVAEFTADKVDQNGEVIGKSHKFDYTKGLSVEELNALVDRNTKADFRGKSVVALTEIKSQ